MWILTLTLCVIIWLSVNWFKTIYFLFHYTAIVCYASVQVSCRTVAKDHKSYSTFPQVARHPTDMNGFHINKMYCIIHLNSCKITCKNIIFQDNVNFDTYTMRDHLILSVNWFKTIYHFRPGLQLLSESKMLP